MKRLLTWCGVIWFSHDGVLQIEVREWPLYACWALDGAWTLRDSEGRDVPVRLGYYRLSYAHVVAIGPLSIRWMVNTGEAREPAQDPHFPHLPHSGECPGCGGNLLRRHHDGTRGIPECWWWSCEDCDFATEPE